MLGPHPRFRLYTAARSYVSPLRDLARGRLHRGDEVEELERRLCARLGTSHAIAMPFARTGIYLALRALIRPGQKVVVQPYTIVDAVNVVLCAGGVPLFGDIERDTCSLDPAEVKKLLDTEDVGAVCVTHLHGVPGAVDEIVALCRARGVPVVEDVAQAFGARLGGKALGTIGTAGIYSFGTYKTICAWYGGAVVTDDAALAARVRAARDAYAFQAGSVLLARMRHGLMNDLATLPAVFKSFTYWIFRFGFLHDLDWINRRLDAERHVERFETMPPEYLVRMTPAQARLLLPQLDAIDRDTAIRVRSAELYREGLAEFADRMVLPRQRADAAPIYTYFPIQYTPRQELLTWLQAHGRDVAQQHLHNCAELESFAAWRRDCPRAHTTSASTILLPTYPRYPVAEVRRNIDCIRAYFARAAVRGTELAAQVA